MADCALSPSGPTSEPIPETSQALSERCVLCGHQLLTDGTCALCTTGKSFPIMRSVMAFLLRQGHSDGTILSAFQSWRQYHDLRDLRAKLAHVRQTMSNEEKPVNAGEVPLVPRQNGDLRDPYFATTTNTVCPACGYPRGHSATCPNRAESLMPQVQVPMSGVRPPDQRDSVPTLRDYVALSQPKAHSNDGPFAPTLGHVAYPTTSADLGYDETGLTPPLGGAVGSQVSHVPQGLPAYMPPPPTPPIATLRQAESWIMGVITLLAQRLYDPDPATHKGALRAIRALHDALGETRSALREPPK